MYPDEEDDSEFEASPPQSPINYESADPENVCPTSVSALDNYNASYMWELEATTSARVNQEAQENAVPCDTNGNTVAHVSIKEHPRPLWFYWQKGSGYPEYHVMHRGETFQYLYIRYGRLYGVPYEMGTEGKGQQQFMWEMYACPQPPVEAPSIDDSDLKIFTQDTPFNFAIK